MARLAGVDLPNSKRIEIALTDIYGLGRKSAKDILAKTGINPQTKESVEIPACKKPVMKFGKAYKDIINN